MIYLFKSDAKVGNLVQGKGEFLVPGSSVSDVSAASSQSDTSVIPVQAVSNSDIVEDEVDRILSEMNGQIEREMNPLLCSHHKKNKCVHCIPLDPWDEQYLNEKDPPVKVRKKIWRFLWFSL